MPEQPNPVPAPEMAHVLLMDVVGYSLLPMGKQHQLLSTLQATVRNSKEFCRARDQNQLVSLPTGDGMALVFFGDPEAPIRCAMELSRTLSQGSDIKLRMGLHMGPVYRMADINSNSNVAGGGINMAQRVMDCGDVGHILLSRVVADLLVQFGTWADCLHDLGEVEVKHGTKIHVYNFYTKEFGNPTVPDKIVRGTPAPEPNSTVEVVGVRSLVGQTISHYRVLRSLGAGGMGVVYEAEDMRLGRRVAIKSLLEEHSESHLNSAQLQQEARVASSLNHPNICTVYDVGDFHGRYFIVMELLEGETLASHLRNHPIPAQGIAALALQVTEALEYAHSRGLIHRDIKPANIFLTSRGQAKVLDFGIAKFSAGQLEAVTSEFTHGEITDRVAPQNMDRLVGTLSYMSPEQAMGKDLDVRSDLFSLGVVLYEMTTGTLPFRGTSVSEVIDAIVNRIPTPPSHLNPDVPAELEIIISKSLAKKRRLRYMSASEMKEDLVRLVKRPREQSALPSSVNSNNQEVPRLHKRNIEPDDRAAGFTEGQLPQAPATLRQGHSHRIASILFAVAIVATGIFAIYEWKNSGRFHAPPDAFHAMKITRLTDNGKSILAAISPDGKYIAYVVKEAGKQSLRIRQLATGSDMQIISPSTVPYDDLLFSRDGNYAYFVNQQKESSSNQFLHYGALYRIPTIGGSSQKMLVGVQPPIAFSKDGKRLLFWRNFTLMMANVDGTGLRTLADSEKFSPGTVSIRNFLADALAWSPDGKMIASFAKSHVAIIDIADVLASQLETAEPTGQTRPRIASPKAWFNVGHLEWLSDGTGLVMDAVEQAAYPSQLWFISYPNGMTTRVTNDLDDYHGVSLTADSGTLITAQHRTLSTIMISKDANARAGVQVSSAAGKYEGRDGMAWAPDGKLVFTVRTGEKSDIWIMDADGSNRKQLTADSGANMWPSVSPDGRSIFFSSDRGGHLNIWKMDIDGNNVAQITQGDQDRAPSLSPDGKWAVYVGSALNRGRPSGVWRVATGGGEPAEIAAPTEFASLAAISPDGKTIACVLYDIDISNTVKVALMPFDGGQNYIREYNLPIQVQSPFAFPLYNIRWSPDGKSITYIDIHNNVSNIWSQPLSGGPPKQITSFTSDQIFSYAWSANGKQVAVSRSAETSDLVLITNFR